MDKDRIADEVLLLRCQAREEEAFRELITRWEAPLYYYLRRMAGDEQAVLDILQETWIAVFSGIARLDDARRFAPWLYAIARNKAVNWLRREHRYAEMAGIDESIQGEDTPDIDAADAVIVHEALQRLDPPHREALTLYFLEGFSVKELAEVLALPEGTVKSRLYHAKRKMLEALRRLDHGRGRQE